MVLVNIITALRFQPCISACPASAARHSETPSDERHSATHNPHRPDALFVCTRDTRRIEARHDVIVQKHRESGSPDVRDNRILRADFFSLGQFGDELVARCRVC